MLVDFIMKHWDLTICWRQGPWTVYFVIVFKNNRACDITLQPQTKLGQNQDSRSWSSAVSLSVHHPWVHHTVLPSTQSPSTLLQGVSQGRLAGGQCGTSLQILSPPLWIIMMINGILINIYRSGMTCTIRPYKKSKYCVWRSDLMTSCSTWEMLCQSTAHSRWTWTLRSCRKAPLYPLTQFR